MKTKRMFAAFLCLAMIFGATAITGCQKKVDTAGTKTFASENANIKFIRPDQNTKDQTDPYIMAINAYQKSTMQKSQSLHLITIPGHQSFWRQSLQAIQLMLYLATHCSIQPLQFKAIHSH